MARDIYHKNVKAALEKEGWKITDDPLHIDLEETFIEIDMAAEMVFAAQKENEKIAVEVKSFLGKSIISEFHTVIGQFADYRDALEEFEPDRVLYLALPKNIYHHPIFQGRFIQKRLKKENVKIILYDIQKEDTIQWIK
jgi:XisH protein